MLRRMIEFALRKLYYRDVIFSFGGLLCVSCVQYYSVIDDIIVDELLYYDRNT